jgi:hypothetical protein
MPPPKNRLKLELYWVDKKGTDRRNKGRRASKHTKNNLCPVMQSAHYVIKFLAVHY